MAAMAGLLGVRLLVWLSPAPAPRFITPALIPSASANQPAAPSAEAPAPRPDASRAELAAVPLGDPSAAERALLEALRQRRSELEAREAALAEREVLVAAAERRLSARIAEMQALHQRLEAEARQRGEQSEQGMRQLVRLYEGMRPRDAATIFDDLDLAVLIPVLDRMREARAAPVLAAMRPDRARLATTELARHRARPND
jgi:flagellar motility protein MotE (MotC chaperone)